MPYVKFDSEEDRNKARSILEDFAKKNYGRTHGLFAMIRDQNYGIVDFYSEKPYMDLFKGLNFEIIPKEKISSDYVCYLRKDCLDLQQIYIDIFNEL